MYINALKMLGVAFKLPGPDAIVGDPNDDYRMMDTTFTKHHHLGCEDAILSRDAYVSELRLGLGAVMSGLYAIEYGAPGYLRRFEENEQYKSLTVHMYDGCHARLKASDWASYADKLKADIRIVTVKSLDSGENYTTPIKTRSISTANIREKITKTIGAEIDKGSVPMFWYSDLATGQASLYMAENLEVLDSILDESWI